uniref:(northern house mosquito) hypothetical protein n=1 Tax=Culex pipiens TaxID=7175 RepID=A0A8D8BLS7_CULPI
MSIGSSSHADFSALCVIWAAQPIPSRAGIHSFNRKNTLFCPPRCFDPKFVGQLSAQNATTFSAKLRFFAVVLINSEMISDVSPLVVQKSAILIRTPSVGTKYRTSTGNIFVLPLLDASVSTVTYETSVISSSTSRCA